MSLNKRLFTGAASGTKVIINNADAANYFAINHTDNSGKWYFEVEYLAATTANTLMIGLYSAGYVDGWQNTRARSYYASNGNRFKGTTSYSYGDAYGVGDIVGVAFNGDDDEITYYKNNSSQGVAFSSTEGDSNFGIQLSTGLYGAEARILLGSSEWNYSAPSGFNEWTDSKDAYDTDDVTTSGSSKVAG